MVRLHPSQILTLKAVWLRCNLQRSRNSIGPRQFSCNVRLIGEKRVTCARVLGIAFALKTGCGLIWFREGGGLPSEFGGFQARYERDIVPQVRAIGVLVRPANRPSGDCCTGPGVSPDRGHTLAADTIGRRKGRIWKRKKS